jgi:hypothetical protein
MGQDDAWHMVRHRAAVAGIFAPIGNHTVRATGITPAAERLSTPDRGGA